ncbi:MAG: tRNA (adenosine(37)-N6)-threonylcarbamoyltransferase complex transferase subunit TsaD [Alphaproteobacteria bacterium]|nr:tRNA (adenosine(37)-N6)-threonylcarbamoyltransferase complex transferase subunit TsaD [Alphaproteobacteria bacterium]
MGKDVLILGIESSCDETSVAIVKNGREVITNVISSQIDIHKLYGGVVPEIASRNHVVNIDGVLTEALEQAKVTIDDIDAIAVTYGAGLLGALIVGVNFAKALSYKTGKPLIAVNHIEGHIAANYIEHKDLKPPFACLIVSGGHTALCKMSSYTERSLIGTTLDDAIGEAFDKVARECGLEYPGGPNIQKQALNGTKSINFVVKPHEKLKDFNFSYSGLKTAVINYLHNKRQKGEEISVPDVCHSFQEEAVNQVVYKSIEACKKFGLKTLVLAGGVSANARLRELSKEEGEKNGINVLYPPLRLCTDNAAMIASAGYFSFIEGKGIADNLTLAPSSTIAL